MRFRLLLPLLFVSFSVGAAPVIDVRARTRATIDAVVPTGSGVRIRGSLTDSLSGEGVVGRHVLIEIDGGQRQVTAATDKNGQFEVTVYLASGQHDIAARFRGDEEFGDTALVPRPYDVDRATVVLDLRVEGSIDATASEIAATVTARSSEGPEMVRLSVCAGDVGAAADSLTTLATVTTDGHGEATLSIPRERLGVPGEKRIAVRFEGNDSLNPAGAEATFFLQTTTRLTDLTIPRGRIAYEADLVAAGRLLDAESKPVTGARVVLAAGGKRVREAVTDGKGSFELRAPAADQGPGMVQITIAHESNLPWRRGTRLGPYPVEIAPPEPVPLSYTLVTFAVTAAAVFAYVLLRSRPWLRLAVEIRRRRRKPEAATVLATPEEAPPTPGLRVARPGIISSLRRAADHGFTGRVCDVVRGHPVGGALLVLSNGEDKLELVADSEGHFEIELGPGWWQVEVSAHGYVTESVKAPIPHRGELRGARIDLLPVREKVFAIYRQVAAPLLPKADLWGVWTPREILEHARAARPGGAFGQLTELVEETYFSVRVPEEALVAVAQARAGAAASELAGR